ncbi:glycoside hydrolase family 2 protein [Sediminitomix flava]|uniref:beta-galactosidase n=1 Tax=Sediminitomix flava TaxID=379075 RepID=A0A315Z530_SEDFL|nr:glycoside hydrolase family 2 TIM barrel-domain containing protein [Sediminitomix flava]PWJ37925.1 beta-galactosidase/beta-glucuronidase [Sediminitomix flava]
MYKRIKSSINVLLLLSFFIPILSLAQQSIHTERQYLSGTSKDDTKTWDFFCSEGRNSGKWTKIEVPSCWEQQGFGAYNYGHDPMEDRAKEYGLYRHKFKVSKDWKGREIKIVLEGVMTDAEVKINGKRAGEIHQGSFYEFKYSISKLIHYGKENLLEIKVDKVSANESVNYAERKADFWVFGGIYRPVYLEAFPKENIERVAINAEMTGDISTDIFLHSNAAQYVTLELQDLKGNKLQDLPISKIEKSDAKWKLNTKAQNIQTWNPEQPNLYQLTFLLKDKKGKTLHQYNQRIGFRTVELRESDGVYVNGQRIKFKGVNRHSFHPESGRTTSKALSIEHVNMMKDMNMNAVRMSHYPPDVHFLEVCDSLGLFVIDELCTWHSPKLDTELSHKLVKELVVRDVNHPSILLWANGNETGWNTDLDDDYAIWDIQKREVIHPWNIFKKTNTLHYFRYHAFARDAYSQDKIYFPTEFLHGLYDGGHGAGLDDYWQQMWHMPLSAGGFLWDFADEAILRTDRDGELDTDGNHAADGIVGPYGEKEGSYYTIKEVWSPIYIEDRFIRDDFNGKFRIENRYHFTNLKECKLEAKWLLFDGPNGKNKSHILDQQQLEFPDLAPEQKGFFQVELPPNWQSAHALHLTAFDPYGKEIFTWSYPIQQANELEIEQTQTLNTKSKISWKKHGEEYHFKVGKMEYQFSAKNGILQKVKKEGHVIPLENGPILLGQNDAIDTIYIDKKDEKLKLITQFVATDKTPKWAAHVELSSDKISWTIHPNALLELEVEIKGKRIVQDYKGISFTFPETEVSGMKWLGDGPYRVWRNRLKGTRFQTWQNDYNNTITGVSGFEYPEFKGFYSNLYWAKIEGKNENGFTVYCHTPFTYLHMLTPENPPQDPKKKVSPVFPEGDISFLMNIPGIGSKFQQPETMGPQGHTENYFGNDDDPIRIHLTFDFNTQSPKI